MNEHLMTALIALVVSLIAGLGSGYFGHFLASLRDKKRTESDREYQERKEKKKVSDCRNKYITPLTILLIESNVFVGLIDEYSSADNVTNKEKEASKKLISHLTESYYKKSEKIFSLVSSLLEQHAFTMSTEVIGPLINLKCPSH